MDTRQCDVILLRGRLYFQEFLESKATFLGYVFDVNSLVVSVVFEEAIEADSPLAFFSMFYYNIINMRRAKNIVRHRDSFVCWRPLFVFLHTILTKIFSTSEAVAGRGDLLVSAVVT